MNIIHTYEHVHKIQSYQKTKFFQGITMANKWCRWNYENYELHQRTDTDNKGIGKLQTSTTKLIRFIAIGNSIYIYPDHDNHVMLEENLDTYWKQWPIGRNLQD